MFVFWKGKVEIPIHELTTLNNHGMRDDLIAVKTQLQSTIGFWRLLILFPIGSMYGIFTYIYHKNQPNVGKYTIHGSSGFRVEQTMNSTEYMHHKKKIHQGQQPDLKQLIWNNQRIKNNKRTTFRLRFGWWDSDILRSPVLGKGSW